MTSFSSKGILWWLEVICGDFWFMFVQTVSRQAFVTKLALFDVLDLFFLQPHGSDLSERGQVYRI